MVFDRFPIGQFRLPNNPEVRRIVGRLQTEVWRESGTCPSAVLFANLAVSAKHVLSLILLRTVKVCFVVDYYSYIFTGVLQFERVGSPPTRDSILYYDFFLYRTTPILLLTCGFLIDLKFER